MPSYQAFIKSWRYSEAKYFGAARNWN